MRKMKIRFLSILLLPFFALAQDRIDTDRPDQTESAFNTPKKTFQAEFGFGKVNYDGGDWDVAHPGFLFKYGVAKKIELRLEGGLSSNYLELIPNPETQLNFTPLEIGTRISLLEGEKFVPRTAFIFHLGLPFTASPKNTSQDIFSSYRFAFQNPITKAFSLSYNLGLEWDGYSKHPAWLYTFSPNFDLGEKWYYFLEVFGALKKDGPDEHTFDSGIAYYLNNNMKLDLSGGFRLNDENPIKNFVAIGFSFRILPKEQAK
jgi:hypothetical protein